MIKQASFFDTTFTSGGHKPENEKVKSSQQDATTHQEERLAAFVGIVKYLNKYSPGLARLGDSFLEITTRNTFFERVAEYTMI